MNDLSSAIPNFGFEAPGQAAGYYFQLRFALLKALEYAKKVPTGSIGLENIDDIAIVDDEVVQEVSQLKHSIDEDSKFLESSVQFWRTVSNWCELIDADLKVLAHVKLKLITNSKLADNQCLAHISITNADRNPQLALDGIVEVAKSSENVATAKFRKRFLDLDSQKKLLLIDAITIVEKAPGVSDVGKSLEELLYYSCAQNQLQEFREALEGWWIQRIAENLTKRTGSLVQLLEIEQRVSFLREQFKQATLTVDPEYEDVVAADLSDHTFVKQVRLVSTSDRRLLNTQRDYLKASWQRSKWLREMKIDPNELNQYDLELESRWKNKFAGSVDELSEPDDDGKAKVGRSILAWAEMDQVPIRGLTAQFLSTGSYHILSDDVKVGWHPDFEFHFKNAI